MGPLFPDTGCNNPENIIGFMGIYSINSSNLGVTKQIICHE